MTDARLDITMAADEKAVIKAQANLIGQLDKAIEKYKKLGSESRKTTKESEKYAAAAAKELERFANATKMINRTPLERYADTMRQLNTALKAGKLDQESFNRAAAKAKQEFDGVGKSSKDAFGVGAVANLSSYTKGVVGITSAIALASMAWREFRAEQDRIGEKQFTDAPSLAELAQLADIDPKDMTRITTEAKRTFLEGGAKSLPEAVNLQKALASGDIEEWRADASRLQASGLVPNAELMTTGVIKLAAGMGKDETGDYRQIVSKAFGAGKLGIGSAEELLAASAEASQQAGRLKLTDEEVMAAISTVSAIVGPAEAGTQVKALLKGIEVEGIGGGFLQPGKSLQEQVARLQELEKSGQDIREMLGGRQEGIAGYGSLTSPTGKTAMTTNLANIGKAVNEDWFSERIGLAEGVPENRAAIAKRQGIARKELAAGPYAIAEQVADAVADDLVADMYAKRGGFMATLQRGQNWIDRAAFGNETFIQDYGAQSSPATQQAAEELGLIMDRLGTKFEYLGDQIDGAGGSQERTNAARANQAAAGGAVEAR